MGERRRRDAEFEAFATAQAPSLRRTAFLLTGDWHRAEELTQETLTRIYLAWPRLHDVADLKAYSRTVLTRLVIDWRRKDRDLPVDRVPEGGGRTDAGPELRDELVTALRAMPARQRAVVVLRYWEDLGVAETAQALGCSEGTVKSQAARGLAALRALLPTTQEDPR
ncbi:MAG: SigE family RNA polymerase sigma factor [Motilibacteraceae bacterium]